MNCGTYGGVHAVDSYHLPGNCQPRELRHGSPMTASLRLCYITDRLALGAKPPLPLIQEAVRSGVDLIQIREKDLAARPLVELVRAAVECARGTGTRVVVNDRLDVALAVGACGVHLSTQSVPALAVRRRVPDDFLIGVSCHSLEEALAAVSAGGDYIVLGPIFATPSKLAYGLPLGLGKLREVAARVRIPLLALGGIDVQRVKACLAAGATGISIFQNSDSLQARVRELRAEFTPA
jgi:thiamine-phosphate pyrophosphorylase